MKADYAQATIASIRRVFESMVPIPIQIMAQQDVANGGLPSPQITGDIMAMVGMAGANLTGTLSLFLPAEMATHMAGIFFHKPFGELTPEVLEVVGEIANIIAGGIGGNLADSEEVFRFSMPTVMLIQNQGMFYPSADVQHVIIPVQAEQYTFFVSTAIKTKER